MTFMRLALAVAAPLLLVSCVLSPGKFVSSLHIGKDRSFTFVYAGEVILLDPASSMGEGLAEGLTQAATGEDGQESETGSATGEEGVGEAPPTPEPAAPAKPREETAAQRAEKVAVAEALAKEVGYRSVDYLGQNRFRVDYQMTGRLDRSFVYPINIDAKAVIPWIAVEVRKDGTVRMKALAFGDPDAGMGGIGKPDKPDTQRDGIFTFTTDAELVMHNNEEGAASGPGKKVVWRVTAASSSVPTAVVRF